MGVITMRGFSFLIAGLAILTSSIMPAQAQAPELNPYVMIETFDVEPENAANFAEGFEHFLMAVKGAGIGGELPWLVFQQDTRYHLVLPMESLDRLDPATGEQIMGRIMGTEGESHLMAAMETMGMAGASMTSQFDQVMTDWSYFPAGYSPDKEYAAASVFEAWMKFGVDEAYAESTKNVMGMLTEMGYPYPVIGHRTLVGDGGKVSFVILHDGLADFYGSSSIENVASPAQLEAWGEEFAKRNQMVTKRNSFNVVYVPDLSNPATGMDQ